MVLYKNVNEGLNIIDALEENLLYIIIYIVDLCTSKQELMVCIM